MREIIRLKNNGLDVMDLIATFVIRRIQPLQARARGMWTYTRLGDDTRYNRSEMPMDEFELQMKMITSVTHGLQSVGRVRPLSSENPPTLVRWFVLYALRDAFCLLVTNSDPLGFFVLGYFPISISHSSGSPTSC